MVLLDIFDDYRDLMWFKKPVKDVAYFFNSVQHVGRGKEPFGPRLKRSSTAYRAVAENSMTWVTDEA